MTDDIAQELLDLKLPARMTSLVKAIVLEKVTDSPGKYKLGAIFQWTYKSTDDRTARVRASKALEREGENVLHWKEVR